MIITVALMRSKIGGYGDQISQSDMGRGKNHLRFILMPCTNFLGYLDNAHSYVWL